MKIIALEAENIKKLTAVAIKPDGNMVQITGANGQGKTSVLDAIWWALAGATHIQAEPIRKGATTARIRLDLGEMVVTRKFKANDGTDGYTSSISVENADGAKFPSPQTMLDQLLGSLTFDPLAFCRMDSKAQYDSLARFVPDVDFATIAIQNKADFDHRTDINREAKSVKAQADAIVVEADAPSAKVDVTALAKKLQEASDANTTRETRRLNREKFTAEIAADRLRADTMVTDLDKALTTQLNEKRAELKRLETEAEARIKEAMTEAANIKAKALTTEDKIKAAGPLPDLIDTQALSSQISNAAAINAKVENKARKSELEAKVADLNQKAEALTKSIADRESAKQAKIGAAKMPVDGISFGDGTILFNGVPFNQASDAEQLRVSVAVAMALNPKLRVIRIRDGALLDEKSMKILGELADSKDYQVWIERVDSSGKVGFVLEDGHLKGAELPIATAIVNEMTDKVTKPKDTVSEVAAVQEPKPAPAPAPSNPEPLDLI